MYTFLVNKDDTMIATVRESVYHRSSMMRKLRFLVYPTWTDNGESLSLRDFICTLEYKLPVSGKYIPVVLQPSENLYKDMLEYIVDIDTVITSEIGNVELKLMWTKLEMNGDGTFTERCRPIEHSIIEVLPVAQWSDYIPSADLNNLAQMVLANKAYAEQMKIYAEQLQSMGEAFTLQKADNITYNKKDNSVQLESMGEPIGNKVVLPECNCDGSGSSGGSTGGTGEYDPDGMPTVSFDPVVQTTDTSSDDLFDVVCF